MEFVLFHIDKVGRKYFRTLGQLDQFEWQPWLDKAQRYSLNEATDLLNLFGGDLEREEYVGIKRVL